MLKYKVKANGEAILKDFPIRELYVSPRIDYVSGVTDYTVGLVDGEEIVIKSPYLIGSEYNTINAQNIKRQGKVGVSIVLTVEEIEKPLKFDIEHDYENGTTFIRKNNKKVEVEDNEDGYVVQIVKQKYVEYNGDISYFFNGETENTSGYLINHRFYKASLDDENIEITTYLHIEDGKLTVGDNIYYSDFSTEGEKPLLRLHKIGEPITGGELGEIDGNVCKALSDEDGSLLIRNWEPSNWENVTHFSITKHENPILKPEDVLFGGYNHYITYGGVNYYLGELYDGVEYKGYGIKIGDTYNLCNCGYTDDELFEVHRDLPCYGGSVTISETGEVEEVNDSLYSSHNSGKFVLFIDIEQWNDILVGNYIEVESLYPLPFRKLVETDENDENIKFITHNGDKYFIKDHLYDTITMSDVEYKLNYINETSAFCEVNGEEIYFDITPGKATISHKIYYSNDNEGDELVRIRYGKDKERYAITSNSGVTVDGVDYPVIMEEEIDEDEGNIVSYYVDIYENVKYLLEVTEIDGSSTYLCYPVCNSDELNEIEIDSLQREISSVIVNNWKSLKFSLRKDTFGYRAYTAENGLMDSMVAEKPYTVSNNYLLEKELEILRVQNYISFNFPLTTKAANNIMREDIVKNNFVDQISNDSINRIVDMEKDVYYPVWVEKNEETGAIESYHPVNELRFNLHFRNRTLDNWKVIEDDREFSNIQTQNSLNSNWFMTDYKYYAGSGSIDGDVLQNSSDLLGFLNFSTSEIRNMASKISRSFLRLSFYSTNNPKTQVLLYTSTIFFDENYALQKYMSLKRNSDLSFMDVVTFQNSDFTSINEYIENGSDEYQITSNTVTNTSEVFGDMYLNDGLRLSSRFTVRDKYNTTTSSDGYYIYLFKEYAKKMREATIYLKVEFNHAGVGKTIPFMLPRMSEDGNLLRMVSATDISKLKEGFPMRDIYNQTYIPIRLIYDDNENRYVYYLPDGLREQNSLGEDSQVKLENEVMVFNLFEVKFANESVVSNESNQ